MIVRKLLAAALVLAAASAPAQGKPRKAKNVILFVADAGGIPTLNAASLHAYKAPQKLRIQNWPFVGLSDTSPAGGFVTDSANGMSAIMTGTKTRNGIISQGPDAVRGKKDGAILKTILEYAEEKGLRTGVVTDMPITDATPAACYAHANDRGAWADIFTQAFTPRFGDGVDVMIGAGRTAIETQLKAKGSSMDALASKYRRAIHPALDGAKPESGRLMVVADRMDVRAGALTALELLEKSPKGYFLMVEWDTHTPDPKPGIERMVALDKLIAEIETRVDLKDTLLVFTADHSFALRVVGEDSEGNILSGYDEWKATGSKESPVRLKSLVVDNSHSAEEVATMAIGAGAERVHGFFPNTRLFHVIMDAWGFRPDVVKP